MRSIKSTSGRDDYTIDTFTATPEMEERKKYLKKAKEAIASGEYKDMGVDGSAFKNIYASKIGDKWSIKGMDIDGQEKQIVETADWDDTVDMLERFGVTDYKLLTRDKTYSRPTDGMRHVILMRGTDGNFKVYADSASKGTHAEMYSTPSEQEARRWLEENNVSTDGLRTRGMNPNDDVPRTHTQSSLANFDSYRMKKIEKSFVDNMTEEEKKVIDLVVNTFGMYGGKVLERITHNEEPWKEARRGYGDSIPSSELLPKDRIMRYYMAINQKYGIGTEDGLKTYIHDMLDKAS